MDFLDVVIGSKVVFDFCCYLNVFGGCCFVCDKVYCIKVFVVGVGEVESDVVFECDFVI